MAARVVAISMSPGFSFVRPLERLAHRGNLRLLDLFLVSLCLFFGLPRLAAVPVRHCRTSSAVVRLAMARHARSRLSVERQGQQPPSLGIVLVRL